MMLRIGDFSRVCQVSIKALRHWDDLDLLKPAHTDVESGYRYYTIEQISQVNRILALRLMGLELKQIKQLLNEDLTTSDIRAMLRLKQAQLQQQQENTAAMLTMLEARLKQIDYSGKLPDYEVTLKSVDTQEMLAVRESLATMRDLVELLRETHAYARDRTGTNLLAVFHDTAFKEEHMDVEIGFPVNTTTTQPIALTQDRSMRPVQLPAIELLASTVHNGTWNTLSDGYVHLGNWIDSNGYKIAGAGREIFHHIDWDDGHRSTVTELQFPVEKRNV